LPLVSTSTLICTAISMQLYRGFLYLKDQLILLSSRINLAIKITLILVIVENRNWTRIFETIKCVLIHLLIPYILTFEGARPGRTWLFGRGGVRRSIAAAVAGSCPSDHLVCIVTVMLRLFLTCCQQILHIWWGGL
jgi:hypothetical protein